MAYSNKIEKIKEDSKEVTLASIKKEIVKGIATILIVIALVTVTIFAVYLIPNIDANEAVYQIVFTLCDIFGIDPPAKFLKDSIYYVNYDANGGIGNMNTTMHLVYENSKLAKNQFSKLGHDFVGWELETESGVLHCLDEQSVINLADKGESITLKAIWKIHVYKVTYHLNGGIYIAENNYPTEYTFENAISIPDVEYKTKPDFTLFLGWYEDSSYTIPFQNDLQSNPRELDLYAKWKTITYDSIDSIPSKLQDGPITLNLSQEINIDFLNHTSREVSHSKYNTITVENTVSELILIGTPQKTFKNLCIELINFREGQELIILLEDFNFTTNESSAFILSNCENIKLTIVAKGESSITTSIAGGNVIDISTSNLEIKGTGKLRIAAGNGTNSGEGEIGGNGGVGIVANNFTISETVSCEIKGGNGGNGGYGGAGGFAVNAKETTVLSSKTIKFVGGTGGDGKIIGGASASASTCVVQYDLQTSNVILIDGTGGRQQR